MNRIAVTAALAALMVHPAVAQELTGENLLAGMPEPFELGWQTQKDNMDMFEYVPHGEKVEDWSKMVTIQVFHGAANVEASAVAGQISTSWGKACPGGGGIEAKTGEENGYPFAVWSFDCPLNPDTNKPETMFLKVMVGADALYMVQYAFRAAADKDAIAEAMDYLVQVGVCDSRIPEKACPKS